MDAVQAPIVPVIGDLIRQTPGTISLGQGVVHYGPPQAAIDAARDGAGEPRHARVPGRRRPSPALIERDRGQAARATTASTSRAAAASW